MRIILKWDKKEKDLIFGESGLVGLGVVIRIGRFPVRIH